jgi:hypothetical protein
MTEQRAEGTVFLSHFEAPAKTMKKAVKPGADHLPFFTACYFFVILLF